tara:strand:+ start:2782 stop:3066 length:285 start_codon:yes stop_codon:yes gene_type:complete
MVSVREIKRMFEDIAPERQLPMIAVLEFQTRIEIIMKSMVELCELEAGGDDSNTRLSANHVKLAFVAMNDQRIIERREEELEFGEWNTEEEGDE